MKQVTKASFLRWLNSKPDMVVVGEKNLCGGCPVAYYLMDAHAALMPEVSLSKYTLNANLGRRREQPEWMRRVVLLVDDMPGAYGMLILARQLRARLQDQL